MTFISGSDTFVADKSGSGFTTCTANYKLNLCSKRVQNIVTGVRCKAILC